MLAALRRSFVMAGSIGKYPASRYPYGSARMWRRVWVWRSGRALRRCRGEAWKPADSLSARDTVRATTPSSRLTISKLSNRSMRRDRRIYSRRRIAACWRQELERTRRLGKKQQIVGFYRGHTRPDFAITREDAALFSAYFRNASDVFLLIKPNDGGPPTGGFVIREEGRILSDSPYVQFLLAGTMSVPAVRETPARTPQAVQESPQQTPPRRAVQIVQSAAPRPTVVEGTGTHLDSGRCGYGFIGSAVLRHSTARAWPVARQARSRRRHST